jgi:predicted amidohydrolase YtcJ
MVIPGFQDAHIHPISAGIEAVSCNLNGLETPEQYVAKIKEYADAHPQEPWITGGGWLMSSFGPGGRARRELIDAVVPIARSCCRAPTVTPRGSTARRSRSRHHEGHTGPGGRAHRSRSENRRAVGTLQEGAGSLVSSKAPETTPEQLQAGLRYSIKLLNGFGITGIQDASVDEPDLKTYQAADEAGELSLHVVGSIWWERDQGLEQIENIKRLASTYTKGRVDARTGQDHAGRRDRELHRRSCSSPTSCRARNPAMASRWSTRKSSRPSSRSSMPTAFQVHFHAIGDGAVRQVLDAIEAARTRTAISGIAITSRTSR